MTDSTEGSAIESGWQLMSETHAEGCDGRGCRRVACLLCWRRKGVRQCHASEALCPACYVGLLRGHPRAGGECQRMGCERPVVAYVDRREYVCSEHAREWGWSEKRRRLKRPPHLLRTSPVLPPVLPSERPVRMPRRPRPGGSARPPIERGD